MDEYHREELLKLDRSDQAIKQLETLDAVVKRLTSNMDQVMNSREDIDLVSHYIEKHLPIQIHFQLCEGLR